MGDGIEALSKGTFVPMNQKSSPTALRFGTFEVDPGSHEIRKHGLRISLEGKPFEILMTLLENPGRVVTRKTLRQRLWPDSFVGYEHRLNTAVNKLRETLGDSPNQSAFCGDFATTRLPLHRCRREARPRANSRREIHARRSASR